MSSINQIQNLPDMSNKWSEIHTEIIPCKINNYKNKIIRKKTWKIKMEGTKNQME